MYFLESACPSSQNAYCMGQCHVRIQVTVEMIERAEAEQSGEIFLERGAPNRLAVVVYTSGSTGNPKGVLLSQANLAAMAANFGDIGFRSDDEYCCFASLMFIASVCDIVVGLALGMTLHLIPNEIRKDIHAIAGYYRENSITVTFLPPHMACKYMDCDEESPLRMLLVGSEPVHNLRKKPYRIEGIYASSEGCGIISHWNIEDEQPTYPIGRVVHGLKHYIVDENGQRVAPGQRGELWISGPQVCYGYLDLPEKNKKCFAPNPFSSQHGYDGFSKPVIWCWRVDRREHCCTVDGRIIWSKYADTAWNWAALSRSCWGIRASRRHAVPPLWIKVAHGF